MTRCIHKAVSSNKARFAFALMQTTETTFSVVKEFCNYDRQVPGQIRKTWKTVLTRLNAAEAHKALRTRLGREDVSLSSLQYLADECRLQARLRAQADDDGMLTRATSGDDA